MGVDEDLYKLVLVAHLMAAIVGFGSVSLAGALGAQAKARKGREGLAIAEATYAVTTRWSEWFIYAVPVLGIVLVLLSDDAWKFSQSWISMSFLVYIGALAILHAVHLPNIRRMNALMADLVAAGPPPGGASGPPPQAMELEQRERRAAAVGGLLNLLVAVSVVLMVFKPGV